MMEEELFRSDALVMTGGKDNYGHHLLAFTPHRSDKLSSHTSAAHLVVLAHHLMGLLDAAAQRKGFSFIANLRTASKESLQMIVEVLDKLQTERRAVAAVFAVQPKSKDLQKTLKKLVGLKPSKKHPKPQIYQTILFSDLTELGKHIDRTQLPPEFNGSMKYDHAAWLQFTKSHGAFEKKTRATLAKVPDAMDRVSMTLEYDVPDDAEETQKLVLVIRQKYQDVMRDLNLEHAIDECKAVHGRLRDPDQHPPYKDICRTPSFLAARRSVLTLERELIDGREVLKSQWQKAEARVIMASKVQKYIVKGDKVRQWIHDVGAPSVNQEPEIADCLSKAEIHKTHFETGFYSVAKNVLWLCGKIQKKLGDVVLETKGSNAELLKYSKNFQSVTNVFADALEKKLQVYVNVHNFFLTSSKITKWYQRTLRFLPVQLLRQQGALINGRQTIVFHGTAAWKAAVENHLLHHPAPRGQHLLKLKNVIPVIDSISIRNQARLLVHRTEVLTLVMHHPGRTTLKDMQEVLRWKDQISHGHDDITLNFASSTLDLSRLGDIEPVLGDDSGLRHASSTQSLGSNTARAPKLRVAPRMDESEYGESPYYSLDRNQVLGERLALAESGYHTADRKRGRPKSAHVSYAYEGGDYTASLPRQRPRTASTALSASRPAHHSSVPRLDLSYSDSPELEQPRLTVYRTESTGDVTAGMDPAGDGYERYVSLGSYPAAAAPSTLPPALQHLNITSLQDGGPQPVLKRYDSVTDSGIANSRSDATSRSHASGGVPSPAHRARTPVFPTGSDAERAVSHHRSLPNLFTNKAQLDRQLDVKQANIELIAGSGLSAEEKLNLMAAMCDTGELELNTEMAYKLQAPSPAGGDQEQAPAARTRPKSAGAKPAGNGVPAKPPRRRISKHGAMSKSSENLAASSQLSAVRTPIRHAQPAAAAATQGLEVHHAGQGREVHHAGPGREVARAESATLKPPVHEASDSQTSVSETTVTTAIHREATAAGAAGAAAVSRSGSKKYGIDVAEWVSQQDPHDLSSVESSELLSTSGSMDGHLRKLRAVKNERRAEEEQLQQERHRLKEISIDEEEVHQDEVERALRRAEKLLQEQEALMNNTVEDEDAAPPLPTSQPPAFEYSRGGAQKSPATVAEVEAPRRRKTGPPSRQLSSDKPVREQDGSVSEESGVYTQASSDSRLKQEDRHGYSSPPAGDASGRPRTPRLSLPHTLADFEIQSITVAKGRKTPPVSKTNHKILDKPYRFQDKEKYVPARGMKQMTLQDINIDGELQNGDEHYTSTSTLQDISDHLGNSSNSRLVVKDAPVTVPEERVSRHSAAVTPQHAKAVKVASVPFDKPTCNGHVEPVKDFSDSELTVREITDADNVQTDASMYEQAAMRSSYENVYAASAAVADDSGGMRSSQYSSGGSGGYSSGYDIVAQSYSTEHLNLKTPVIIDNGSGLCKCGLASQDRPLVFPAYVGRPKYEEAMSGNLRENYVGASATSMRGVLKLRYPLEHGIITDWDDMELIWNHALADQVRINPEEHPIMVTEAPLNPKKNRERMAEVLFEYFDAPAMYVAIQAVLALYASGRTTGVVFDCGDGVSHIVPVYEGYSIPHGTNRINLAGRDLTDYLVKLLRQNGCNLTTSAEREIARDIKENHCYVAQDYRAELHRAETTSALEEFYMLPDGHNVSVNSERFSCPEAMFNPSVLGHESHSYGGIHEAIYNSVVKCDIDLRTELFSNILLSGGTTLLPGLGKRIHTEISALCPPALSASVKVNSPDDREYLVWQGGAVLAGLPSFSSSWVFFQEYQEIGADIVHRKCF